VQWLTVLIGLEGVICLNIRSFGGGADFWGKSSERHPFVIPSHSDRLLEVIGVRSSFHMGQIQVHHYTYLLHFYHILPVQPGE
jgi:hypothetical protein